MPTVTGMRELSRATTFRNALDDLDRRRTPDEQARAEVHGARTIYFHRADFSIRSCNGDLCRVYGL